MATTVPPRWVLPAEATETVGASTPWFDGAKALVGAVKAGVRPPGRASVPTPQDPQCRVEAAQGAGLNGREEDAHRYHDADALAAEATLEALARSLEKTHPGAAGSLLEGLAGVFEATRSKVRVHFPFTEHATMLDGEVELTDQWGNSARLDR